MEIPKLKQDKDINLNKLKAWTKKYLHFLNNNKGREVDHDYDHFIFEKAMEALYGKEVWDYINSISE